MSRITAAAARNDVLAGPETDRVLLELEEEEATALASLAEQIEQLLLATEPSDESVSRLYPVAYADAVEAADFARFTRPALQERKVDAAQHVRLSIEGGSELDAGASTLSVEIGPDELWKWLTFLTDLRLVLADSIDLDEDEPAHEPLHEEAEELRSLQRGVYDWAAFLQDSLVAAAEHAEA